MEKNAPEKLTADGSQDTAVSQGDSLEFSDAEAAETKSAVVSGDALGPVRHKVQKDGRPSALHRLWERFNIYLLGFVVIVIVAIVATTVLYVKNRGTTVSTPGTLQQQNLPPDALQQLAKSGVQVGDPKQVLNIQSNSIFDGTVLVRGEIQAAGGIKIGSGSLSVPSVAVGGSASANQLQTQTVDVAGAAHLGDVSVARNLNVNGSGTFNGGLTTSSLKVGSLQLNGDLAISRHLVAGGATPGRSNGGALGGGGTVSVSGSDTAGSITINTGSGPAAGCFVSVNFTNAFSSTPHIVLTPVGSAAGGLSYYINRGTTNFSVCTNSPAPANSSFGFDYVAID